MARRVAVSHPHLLAAVLGAGALAGGLTGLASPVTLGDYDTFGIQINCGSGLHTQLLQAGIDDAQPSAPAQDRLGQCRNALAHRREWAAPLTAVGATVLLASAAAWVRRPAAPGPEPPHPHHRWGADHPDDDMHDAAMLDRRHAAHGHRHQPTDSAY